MGRVLAIAKLTMKGAFRVKAFVALLAFLVVCVVALPLTVEGDGTVRGHVQILLSYSLGISFAILCLATMWLACDSLCRDVDDQHIHLIATKPIYRWEIWFGKWIGIMSLNALLLGLVGLVVYGLLLWTTRPGQLTKRERHELVNEVLVARKHVSPEIPDVTDEVNQKYQERQKAKNLPEDVTPDDFRKSLRHDILAARFAAGTAKTVRWQFKGIRVDKRSDAPVFIRFKHFTSVPPPNQQVWGEWRFGEPNSPNLTTERVAFKPDSFHELSAPATTVNANGTLTVEYTNVDPFPTTVRFPLSDGIEVLYRVGSFAGNYIRSLLLLLIPLGLLASIALCAGSFLTFPVAAFVSMSYLYLVLLSGPLEGVMEQSNVVRAKASTPLVKNARMERALDTTVRHVIRGGLYMTSSVRKYNPIGDLVVGRVVSWAQVGKVFGHVLLLQAASFALFGIYLFTRRELAVLQR